MQKKQGAAAKIEALINVMGKYISLLIVIMMASITYEVISRYLFNRPTTWAWLINRQLFGLFILMAGPYAMIQKAHIRIEMLYDRFRGGARNAVKYLSFIAMLLFLGALVWQGAIMGYEGFVVRERAVGLFPLPLYPLKLIIPVFGLLFILAGALAFLRKTKS